MSSANTTQIVVRGPVEFEREFGVSRETRAKLEAYAAELLRWQKAINLVAPGSIPELWHRHFADSAQLVAVATTATGMPAPTGKTIPSTWLDLGSGGGFPGLVVAIMLSEQSKTRVTLIESDSRKAAFLRNTARIVGVPVDIFCERAERAATRSSLKGVDVVSARALAPLPQLLTWTYPFVGPHTKLLLPKGRSVDTELQDAENKWKFDRDLRPSLTDSEARIAVVTNLAPRPAEAGKPAE